MLIILYGRIIPISALLTQVTIFMQKKPAGAQIASRPLPSGCARAPSRQIARLEPVGENGSTPVVRRVYRRFEVLDDESIHLCSASVVALVLDTDRITVEQDEGIGPQGADHGLCPQTETQRPAHYKNKDY